MSPRMDVPHSEGVWPTKIDASGRVFLPTDARVGMGVGRGDPVVLVRDEAGLHIKTLEEAARDVQEYYASVWPKDRSVVDELITERRQEAARDARGD